METEGSQRDSAAPRPQYTGANMRVGRADGPSAVFSRSLASAFQYPKMSQDRNFLGCGFGSLGPRTTADGFSLAVGAASCVFVFSARCSSDAVVEGTAELAREANAERRAQTSLMSFSSKSRHVGMMLSRSYVQTTITRSSRCSE